MPLFRRRTDRKPEPMPQGVSSTNTEAIASLLYGVDTAPVHVSARTASGLPALDAGVSLIASQVAVMMANADVLDVDGQPITPTPALVRRPFPAMTSQEFWETQTRALLMSGNAYALPINDNLVPIDPGLVSVDASQGLPTYTIGALGAFRWDEVWHVRRHAPPGSWVGLGIVARYRTAVEGMLHEQAYGSNSYASGAVPSAVITLDTANVTQEVAEQYQARWIERHGSGQRKPAVVPRSISIQPLSWSPKDTEYVLSRQLSAAEAAYMCGLAPSDLEASGGGAAITYANLTDRVLRRVSDVYAPIVGLFEAALSDLLPLDQTVSGSSAALLKALVADRFDVYAKGKALGIYTPEELREMEHRPALPQPPEQPAPETTEEVDDVPAA